MKKTLKKLLATCTGGLCFVAAIALSPSTANAELLISVDLTVPNQITVNATSGLSSATVSGPDTTGFYLEDFYSVNGTSLIDSAGTGNLTNFLNPSDGSPGIFRASGSDPGFNVWTFSSDFTVDFVAGTQAFTGSGMWNLSVTEYAEAIADGNRGGDIYFAADSVDDLPGATLIGQYEVIVTAVPAPGAFALLGLAGVAARGRRRRA